jgi:hypothetical protein
MTGDVPLPFDDALVEEHAVQHDLALADLREALRAVQATAGRHVGVDGLVYEWRGAFAEDPLVARSPEVWELVVETRVWRDFAERCDLDRRSLRAVMAVHAAHVEASHDPADLPLGDPMVLARP